MAYRVVQASQLPSLADRADDELLTVEECAAYLRLSPSTLEKWRIGFRGNKAGPVYVPLHDGPKSPIRYKVADVRDWLNRQRVDPSNEEDSPAPAA